MVGESAEAFRARTGRAPELKAVPGAVVTPEVAAVPGNVSEAETPAPKEERVRGEIHRTREEATKTPAFRLGYEVRAQEAQRFETGEDKQRAAEYVRRGNRVDQAGERATELESRSIESNMIDKEQLVKTARERVSRLEEEEHEARGAVQDTLRSTRKQVDELRQKVTQEYGNVDLALRELEGKPNGHVGVELTSDVKTNLELTKAIGEIIGKSAEPFELHRDKEDGSKFDRLAFRASDNMVMVERWDREAGTLLALDIIKSPDAIKFGYDLHEETGSRLLNSINAVRASFRDNVLDRSEQPGDKLTKAAEAMLPQLATRRPESPVLPTTEQPAGSAGSERYRESLLYLGMSEDYVDQNKFDAKPRRPVLGFWETLFGGGRSTRRRRP